jgi:hypothetical protein
MFIAFWLIIEGDTEKVLQLKSIYKKKLVSLNKKCIFGHYRGLNKKKSINWHYFCDEILYLMTFSELPCIVLY